MISRHLKPRGVRNPRPRRVHPTALDEPRQPANRDWLATERRRLLSRRDANETHTFFAYVTDPNGPADLNPLPTTLAEPQPQPQPRPAQGGGHGGPPKSPAAPKAPSGDANTIADLTLHVYRYTKQADLSNDEMGYGELVIERLLQPEIRSKKLTQIFRVSQRTKTGRQRLEVDEVSLEESHAAEKKDDE